jgi:hypothetical protein
MEGFVRSFNQGRALDGEECRSQASITIGAYAALKEATDALAGEIHSWEDPT